MGFEPGCPAFGRGAGRHGGLRVRGHGAGDGWQILVPLEDDPRRRVVPTVTVRMRNAGTTTWTSSAGYQLGSQRPDDNVRWGLSRVALPSEVPPNGEVDFTFEVVAPETVKGHKFRWRMVRGTDGWFGERTELHEITVEDPSFGDAAVPAQTWAKNVPIESFTLPAAVGGDGALTYSLTPSLPEGVTFTAARAAALRSSCSRSGWRKRPWTTLRSFRFPACRRRSRPVMRRRSRSRWRTRGRRRGRRWAATVSRSGVRRARTRGAFVGRLCRGACRRGRRWTSSFRSRRRRRRGATRSRGRWCVTPGCGSVRTRGF